MRNLASKDVDLIVVHCSDTYDDQDIGVKEITRHHVEYNKWSDIGYHYVIRRDGTLEAGRDPTKRGAHAQGYNFRSIGVCLIGGKSRFTETKDISLYTDMQLETLKMLLAKLSGRYRKARVIGHRVLSAFKTCPNFNVTKFLDSISPKFVSRDGKEIQWFKSERNADGTF